MIGYQLRFGPIHKIETLRSERRSNVDLRDCLHSRVLGSSAGIYEIVLLPTYSLLL